MTERTQRWYKAAGIAGVGAALIAAACLRPAITAVGPVLVLIGADTGMSNTLLGLLGALPLLAFAAVSPLVFAPVARLGVDRAIGWALAVLAVGVLVRSLPGVALLWLGTAVLGAGIAVCNVLIPVVIKRDHAGRVAWMTGLYSAVLGGAAALASGVALPLASALPGGWRWALGVWALPSGAAALLWLRPRRPRQGQPQPGRDQIPTTPSTPTTPSIPAVPSTPAMPVTSATPALTFQATSSTEAVPATPSTEAVPTTSALTFLATPSTEAVPTASALNVPATTATMGAVLAGDEGSAASPVWRSGYAWRVTVLMGLQSTTFYVMVSWLPAIIAADGISHAAAGWYLLVYQAVGVLAGLALPMVLRRAGQRVAGGLVGLPMAVACVGLILLPSVLPLWILLAGLSTGCALVLALSLISLGARGPRHGAQLSGMAQAIGYLLAATGPIVAGWLRDQTGSWTPTLILIAAIATTQTLVASARLP